jgi:predicted SAM-dependent methyltransferase
MRIEQLELGEQSYQDLVDDAYRILKPGGYLEIVEPSK